VVGSFNLSTLKVELVPLSLKPGWKRANCSVDLHTALCKCRTMLGETKKQFSLTRAATSTGGRAKSNFLPGAKISSRAGPISAFGFIEIFLVFSLVFCCRHTFAQTNINSGLSRSFSLPSLQLRPFSSESETTSPKPSSETRENLGFQIVSSQPVQISLSYDTKPSRLVAELTLKDTQRELEIYRRLEAGGYLTRQNPTSDNALDRALDSAFLPATIHFRKFDLSCSLVTAIQRKNPLCLLNPIFLNVSW
jgi:hypothetical protein